MTSRSTLAEPRRHTYSRPERGKPMEMPAKRFPRRRLVVVGAVGLLLAAVGLGLWFDPLGLRSAHGEGRPREKVADEQPLAVELVPDEPDTLSVPPDVQEALGIRRGGRLAAVATAETPEHGRPLVMPG